MHTHYMVKIGPISDIGFFNHLLRLEYGTFRLFAGDDSKQSGEMFLAGLGRGKSDAQKNHSASPSPESDADSSKPDEPSSSERAAASADAIRSD